MGAPSITQSLQALGPYRLELLGFDGVLATFRAQNRATGEFVVLVAVAKSLLARQDCWASFTKHVMPLTRVEASSRLCRPINFGDDLEHLWASYEWLEGSHLGAVVRDRGLPDPAVAFQWMAQVAEALAGLHRRGVRHGILSPASIFLTAQGDVRVLHSAWGDVVLSAREGLRNPSFASILPFASPEIAAGSAGDEASDVYSIGAHLYFLCTGQPVFWHDDPKTLGDMIHSSAVDLGPLQTVLSPDAVELIHELLAKDPQDRPVNLPALADRLASLARRSAERASQAADSAAEQAAQAALAAELAAGRGHPTQASSLAVPTLPPPEQPRPAAPPVPPPLPRPQPAAPAAEEGAPPPAAGSKTVVVLDQEVTTKAQQRNRLIIFAACGVVGLGAFLSLIASFFLGSSEPEPPPKPAKKIVIAVKKAEDGTEAGPGTEAERIELTRNRLRINGQLARGFNRRNGDWPTTLEDLQSLGAKQEEFLDGWNRVLEMRKDFVFSMGPDGKWDTDDDLWYDCTEQLLGGLEKP